MKLFVLLAVFDGCPATYLNDPEALRKALDLAVEKGSFTGLGTLVVPFSPQGVTACAVVGESHIALHTWPEEGRLFVDIASCSTRESTERALDAIRQTLPSGNMVLFDERLLDLTNIPPMRDVART